MSDLLYSQMVEDPLRLKLYVQLLPSLQRLPRRRHGLDP